MPKTYDAYGQGVAARKRGKLIDANPYVAPNPNANKTLYDWWRTGWKVENGEAVRRGNADLTQLPDRHNNKRILIPRRIGEPLPPALTPIAHTLMNWANQYDPALAEALERALKRQPPTPRNHPSTNSGE